MPGRVVIFGWSESIHVKRWVAGLSARGWKIRLISQGGGPAPGAETINLGEYGKFSFFRHASAAARLAREFDPDLIHVHYAGGFGWWGLKCRFAPMLVSVWGSDVIGVERNLIQRLLVRRVLHRADRISVTSAYLKAATAALAPGVEDKIEVIPFGVSVPEPVSPLPPPPVRLCFIKLHRPQYGPDILLRALANVRQTIPDIRLTLAGEGTMTPRLRTLCVELGLESNVDFVGFVPNDRIYSLLSEHHIMVMPSLSESFGVAVLEAAACGRPSIASRVGGVPEVLRDGETGLLVSPGDPTALAEAILRLSGDLERCRQMGQAGRNLVVANFEWKVSLDQMHDLYERLIRG
jgi:glycosyltransferase involved in cell wall biosynthesis